MRTHLRQAIDRRRARRCAAGCGCAARRAIRAADARRRRCSSADPALFTDQPYDPRWWTQFDDPVLDALEDRGAATRTSTCGPRWRGSSRRARCSTTSTLDRFPTVTVGASVDRREQAIPGFTDEPIRTVDLPRRLRRVLGDRSVRPRAVGGAGRGGQRRRAYDAALDDVRVSVAAEVARNYFELRGLQQQLAVAERSLANQQETLRLTRVRRDAGIGEEQDVASAAARVAAIEASLPPLRAAIAGAAHRLAVLVGAASRRADRRSRAARLSAARQGAAARRSGDAAAAAARRPRRRTARSPRRRRAKASPPPTSFRGSRSPAFSASSPGAAACSAAPTRAPGR